jgi:ABC-type sulfate/molybdate transport systems ATPase subunit
VDVVRLGLDGDRWGLPVPGRRYRAAAERVAELVDLVGARAYAHRPIGQLSGGEQQRLLVAQALARRPRLLMLDEPLDSLDLPNQAAVAALISRIARAENVAVIIVAHDVNPILPYLDRVIYLGSGGAVSGTPAEVITKSTLTALYGALGRRGPPRQHIASGALLYEWRSASAASAVLVFHPRPHSAAIRSIEGEGPVMPFHPDQPPRRRRSRTEPDQHIPARVDPSEGPRRCCTPRPKPPNCSRSASPG